MPDARCVWITDADFDPSAPQDFYAIMRGRWRHAAPDATEAAREAVAAEFVGLDDETCLEAVQAVLGALGMPEAPDA